MPQGLINRAMMQMNVPKASLFTFERQPDEDKQEYEKFTEYLASQEDISPARWVTRHNESPILIDVSARNNWLSRKTDYWNFLAARQRAKWVELLDTYREDLLKRRDEHLWRLGKAIEMEKAEFAEYELEEIMEDENGKPIKKAKPKLNSAYDRALHTYNNDLRAAVEVVASLSGSERAVQIINTAVGAINVPKDVAALTRQWDASSAIVEGVAREVEKEDSE